MVPLDTNGDSDRIHITWPWIQSKKPRHQQQRVVCSVGSVFKLVAGVPDSYRSYYADQDSA
jgi:hypothetical protein